MLFRKYVNLCTRTSFRHFNVVGLENMPKEGPVILASNHCAALMDPLAICAATGVPITFGTRADLFRKPQMAAILRWFLMVPLARHERDSMSSVAHNRQVFEEVAETVKHLPFALFVEGTHRPKRSLMPLRKGVFWISDHALDHGCECVYIVPVGLEYGSYYDFMTDITVSFGKPIEYREGGNKTQLTQELFNRMSSLITYFPDDENYEKAVAEFEAARKPERKWWKYPLALLLLPFFIVCGAICSPLLLGSGIIIASLEDKAWSNTVRYGFRLLFFIIWPFHSAFYLILNFYKTLI